MRLLLAQHLRRQLLYLLPLLKGVNKPPSVSKLTAQRLAHILWLACTPPSVAAAPAVFQTLGALRERRSSPKAKSNTSHPSNPSHPSNTFNPSNLYNNYHSETSHNEVSHSTVFHSAGNTYPSFAWLLIISSENLEYKRIGEGYFLKIFISSGSTHMTSIHISF